MSAPRIVFLGLNSPTPIRRIGKDVSSQQMPVPRIDGCCIDFYQHFFFIEGRLFHLFEMKNIWRSISCVYNRFHFVSLSNTIPSPIHS